MRFGVQTTQDVGLFNRIQMLIILTYRYVNMKKEKEKKTKLT